MSTNLPGNDNRRWALLGGVLLFSFLVLGFFGREVYRQAPPIPDRVVTPDGSTVMTKDDILTGQQVWQSTGGQQLGSIWGHGAYQAPDWTADHLHREAVALLDVLAEKEGARNFASLTPDRQAALKASLVREMRVNTYDAATGAVTVSAERAEAYRRAAAHFDALFGGAPELKPLREDYAMSETTVPDAARRKALTAFFFWTSWAAATERPGSTVTFTNNWPHEPLIENVPSGANVVWSFVSIVLLLAGIGAVVWWQAFREKPEPAVVAPPPSTRSSASRSRRRCARSASTSPPSSASSRSRSASARSWPTTPSKGRRSTASPSASGFPTRSRGRGTSRPPSSGSRPPSSRPASSSRRSSAGTSRSTSASA